MLTVSKNFTISKPLLSGHLERSRGCPLNRGFTVCPKGLEWLSKANSNIMELTRLSYYARLRTQFSANEMMPLFAPKDVSQDRFPASDTSLGLATNIT